MGLLLSLLVSTITAPINTSSTSLESIIWSPNYPDSYDGNYDQVKQNIILPNVLWMYYDLLQEWTLQSTDGQPVTLTFNSFDVGTLLPAPSTGTSYIWTPNYPNYYESNYQQVTL